MQGKKWENGRANETISAQSEINHWKLWQFQPSQVIKENMTGAWEFWFQYANVALLILNWAKRLKQSPAGGRGAALCSSIIASQLNICSRGPFEKASILLFLLCPSNTYKIYIRAHTHTHTHNRHTKSKWAWIRKSVRYTRLRPSPYFVSCMSLCFYVTWDSITQTVLLLCILILMVSLITGPLS